MTRKVAVGMNWQGSLDYKALIERVQIANAIGVHSAWVPEAWGVTRLRSWRCWPIALKRFSLVRLSSTPIREHLRRLLNTSRRLMNFQVGA